MGQISVGRCSDRGSDAAISIRARGPAVWREGEVQGRPDENGNRSERVAVPDPRLAASTPVLCGVEWLGRFAAVDCEPRVSR